MGENADLMIDGTLCQICGSMIDGDSPGYPRTCSLCCKQDDKLIIKGSVYYVGNNRFTYCYFINGKRYESPFSFDDKVIAKAAMGHMIETLKTHNTAPGVKLRMGF